MNVGPALGRAPMNYLNLDPLLLQALREDIGRGDRTTEAVLAGESVPASGDVVARERLVLAGWPVFVRAFELLGEMNSTCRYREGDWVEPGSLGNLKGSADVLLKGERVALNLLQRLCGIATRTRLLADRIAHTPARLLDTRKTTPLWRELEKYAVRTGGGANHRHGLDDGILIKENHIAMAGGVLEAIAACRRHAAHLQRVEVEVRNLAELDQALAGGAEAILLDNMSVEQVREAVRRVEGRCKIEVSGGLNEDTLVAYAETGADFLSMGALTHSVRACDVSLLLETL